MTGVIIEGDLHVWTMHQEKLGMDLLSLLKVLSMPFLKYCIIFGQSRTKRINFPGSKNIKRLKCQHQESDFWQMHGSIMLLLRTDMPTMSPDAQVCEIFRTGE